MPELHFDITGAHMLPYAATPQLAFKLRVSQAEQASEPPLPLKGVALRCQVRIEPAQRGYDASTREKLRELFGRPEEWNRSLRGLLWEHVQLVIPAFERVADIDLPVPCTFDFNIAATKYFDALPDGEVPLTFLFSGTIFYADAAGALRIAQIPWDKEVSYRLPVTVWRETVEHYYPRSAWLCLDKELFDRLHAYKREMGLPTWDRTLERLLDAAERSIPS